MIVFEDVSKRYANGVQALTKINFTIKPGEFVFLTGHSGAGKSSLLKLIALIERQSYGQIFLNQQELRSILPTQVPFLRRLIGLIFQNPMLLNDRTVFDNVALPLVIAGYRYQDIRKRVSAALEKVSLLKKAYHYPRTLSGGEQQRLGIARAVVNKPRILLADEPTGNLDPELSAEIMHLFELFSQVGVSVLVASHDLALIESMGHRVLSIAEGRLVNDQAKKH